MSDMWPICEDLRQWEKGRLLDSSGRAVKVAKTESQIVEITRSFSFKLNLGNYQSADFFCSQKAQARPEDAEEVSLSLYEFCYDQVMESVQEVRRKQAEKAQRSAA